MTPLTFASRHLHHDRPATLQFARWTARWTVLYALALGAAGLPVHAAPYEAKVHQPEAAPFQEKVFELETKWVRPPQGEPGGSVLLGRAEVAYGLTRHSEISVNLFASRQQGKLQANGGKIAHIQVFTEDEKATWRFGMKNEVVLVTGGGEPDEAFYEFTPIVQWQAGAWNLTVNPSLDLMLRGKREWVFAPTARLGLDLPDDRALSLEYYAEMGPVKRLLPAAQRPDIAYLSFESAAKGSSWSVGVGRGVRAVSDRWVLRVIAAFPFR